MPIAGYVTEELKNSADEDAVLWLTTCIREEEK